MCRLASSLSKTLPSRTRLSPLVIIVGIPATAASSAAAILVAMPPVPTRFGWPDRFGPGFFDSLINGISRAFRSCAGLVVDTFDVAQNHQQSASSSVATSADKMIVVAELHFLHSDGVVFIDDRNIDDSSSI